MSFAEIEAQLETLTPDELRSLALKSWSAFVAREALSEATHQCEEDDPDLLAALDEAVAQADAPSHAGYSGEEVRARISEWTSK
jgi:predicted metal-dependent HD superfamily phosphohydrolase